MSSTVTHITAEKVNGDTIFIVRQYNSIKDIGAVKPIDMWESFDLVCDTTTVDYLVAIHEDELAWEKGEKEFTDPGSNQSVHPIMRKIVNKIGGCLI